MKTWPRLTPARIAAIPLPVAGKRTVTGDGVARGLFLRTTAAGTHSWLIVRRVNGRMARVTIGQYPEVSIEAARRRAEEVSGDIVRGVDPRRAKFDARNELTLAEVFDRHLDHAKVHNKAWQQERLTFDRYLRPLAGRRLSEITRQDVQARHARIGEKHGKYVANRTLALIAHVYATTARDCGFTGANPCDGIQRFREQSRERFLHPDEMPKFIAALDDDDQIFRDFFLLALFTGARKSNLLAMAWADVSIDRAVWRIPDTKSGDAVSVPLSPEAIEILESRLAVSQSPWVFPGHRRGTHLKEPKAAWRRILARSGLTDLRIHDLRRTFGSWQAAAGVSLPMIGKSLGHKSPLTTAIYARLNIDPVRKAVDAASAAMMAAGKSEK